MPFIDDEEEISYTVKELVRKLGIPEGTLKDFIKEGELKGAEVKGETRVSQSALRDFFEGAGKEYCRRKKEREVL